MSTNGTPGVASPEETLDECLAQLLEALRGVRFGTITLTIHEGRVTEIGTTRRTRLVTTK